MLHFVITLPPTRAADVVQRELKITIGDQTEQTVHPELTAAETQEFSGNDNDAVHAELVDIDDATPPNRSEPSVLDGVLTDTVAPPQPGQMGIRVTRED